MCSTRPPLRWPSLLNLSIAAGHRQLIKPGLGGYQHTADCNRKSSRIPPFFQKLLSLFILLSRSFIPFLHFILSAPVFVSSFCLHMGVETLSHDRQPLEKKQTFVSRQYQSLPLSHSEMPRFRIFTGMMKIVKRGPRAVPEPLDAS